MKNIVLTTLLFFGILLTGYGQTNLYYQNNNILPPEDFYNISFNGITLGSIIDTKGDPAKVNTLFGMTMEANKSNDPNYFWINFGNDAIGFTFDELIGDLDLSRLEVKSNQVAVKIGDKIIHIGDSIEKLGNIKILTQTDGNKVILFITKESDGVWISIDFNPTTKIITKISYMAT